MYKGCYTLFIVLLCSFTLPVKGQKALDETIKKNVLLEKDIDLLKTDSAKVKNRIKEVLLQIEKDSTNNKEFEREYNAFMEYASQDSIMILRHYVDSLNREYESLQASVISIQNDIREKAEELKNIESEVQNMNVYSEIEKQRLYESNKQYMDQRYSQISLEKLIEISNSIDEYSLFEDYIDYQNRIVRAINNKKLFDKAWDCVNAGNDYQNILDLRLEITALLEVKTDDIPKGIYKLTTEQFNEMDSLDIKLSRFNNGIKELQSIVKKINNDKEVIQIRKSRKSESKNDCIALMKQYIIPGEENEQARIYERYFKTIPYLEKLLKEYWDELEANPFDTPTKTEKIITNLIVK